MRVLNRPSMARKPGQDGRVRTEEAQLEQPVVAEQSFHHSDERPELQAIAAREARRQRPILGSGTMIARAERKRNELRGIAL